MASIHSGKRGREFIIMLATGVILLAMFVGLNLPEKAPKVGLAEGYNADLSGEVYQDEKFAFIDGEDIELPQLVYENRQPTQVLGVAEGEKWIEVDLSEQKLYAWEGNSLFLETAISTGLPSTPTPEGEFRIWIKLRATKMEGGSGRGYYYLPNVPYTMFFENSEVPGWRGYGLHGTYWHNDFGTPRSHGCVNLPTPVAGQLYEWVNPLLPEGKGMVRSSAQNPGTRIVIHQ